MEEEHEALDWGNEDDEPQADYVSLGGEEADLQELEAFHSRNVNEEEDTALPYSHKSPEVDSSDSRKQHVHEQRQSPPPARGSKPSSNSSRSRRDRNQQAKRELTLPASLPAKPVGPPVSFRNAKHASIMDATTMQEKDRDRRRGRQAATPMTSDELESLPPDWEIRTPRNPEHASDIYYYNVKTAVSQWNRPTEDGKPPSPVPAKDREPEEPRLGDTYGKGPPRRVESLERADSAVESTVETRGRPPSRSHSPRRSPEGRESRRVRRRDSTSRSPSRFPPDDRRDLPPSRDLHRGCGDMVSPPRFSDANMSSPRSRIARDDALQQNTRRALPAEVPRRSRRSVSPPGPYRGTADHSASARNNALGPRSSRPLDDRRDREQLALPPIRNSSKYDRYVPSNYKDDQPLRSGDDYGSRPYERSPPPVRRAKSRSPPPSHTRTRDTYPSRAAPTPGNRSFKQGEIVRSDDFDDRLQSARRASSPPRGDSYRVNGTPTLRRTREADIDRDHPDNDPKRQRTGQFPDPEFTRRPARRELSRSPPPSRPGETESEDNNARFGRKRAPLPPQSESYRETKGMPPPPPPNRHQAPSRVTSGVARDRPLREDGMDRAPFDSITSSSTSHNIPQAALAIETRNVDTEYARGPSSFEPSPATSRFGGRRFGEDRRNGLSAGDVNDPDAMDVDMPPSSHRTRSSRFDDPDPPSARADRDTRGVPEDLGPRERERARGVSVSHSGGNAATSNKYDVPYGRRVSDSGWKPRERSPPPTTPQASQRSTRWGPEAGPPGRHVDSRGDATLSSTEPRARERDEPPARWQPPREREQPSPMEPNRNSLPLPAKPGPRWGDRPRSPDPPTRNSEANGGSAPERVRRRSSLSPYNTQDRSDITRHREGGSWQNNSSSADKYPPRRESFLDSTDVDRRLFPQSIEVSSTPSKPTERGGREPRRSDRRSSPPRKQRGRGRPPPPLDDNQPRTWTPRGEIPPELEARNLDRTRSQHSREPSPPPRSHDSVSTRRESPEFVERTRARDVSPNGRIIERKRSDIARTSRFETNPEDPSVRRSQKPPLLPPDSPKRPDDRNSVPPTERGEPPVGGTLRLQASRATLTDSSSRSLELSSSETRHAIESDVNGRRSSQPVRIRRPKGDDKLVLDGPVDTQPLRVEEARRNADGEKSEGQPQHTTSLLERLSMDKGERQPASWDREDNGNGSARGNGDRDDPGWRKGGRRGPGRSKPRRARAQRS